VGQGGLIWGCGEGELIGPPIGRRGPVLSCARAAHAPSLQLRCYHHRHRPASPAITLAPSSIATPALAPPPPALLLLLPQDTSTRLPERNGVRSGCQQRERGRSARHSGVGGQDSFAPRPCLGRPQGLCPQGRQQEQDRHEVLHSAIGAYPSAITIAMRLCTSWNRIRKQALELVAESIRNMN
jgi:hypothetical protein